MKSVLTTTIAAVAMIAGSTAAFAETDDSQGADLYQLEQLHASFHRAASHAGVDAATKSQHLADMLAIWTDDGTLIAGTVTYSGRGTPGTASCDPGSNTLCDFFANHAGSFVLGRNWISLSPAYLTAFAVHEHTHTADIYFACDYFDLNNGNANVANPSVGVRGTPGTGQARKVHGQWLLSYVIVGSAPLASD